MLPLPDARTATAKRIARKYKLAGFPDRATTLHVRCGDDILAKLDAAGLAGDKVSWSDPLCEGPLFRGIGDEDRQRRRASYLASRFNVPMTETFRSLSGMDWRVDQCTRYERTLLWFEADLYDQAILVFLLARLYPMLPPNRLEMICVDTFPGVPRFVGLGQLSPGQLATLVPQRRVVTQEQYALAVRACEAFTAATPDGLIALSKLKQAPLPFLPAAIRRYLAEYPSVRNGLSQTERWALEALARGARNTGAVFRRVQQREPRPFMGDSMFFAVLRTLASGTRPAIAGALPRMDRLNDRQMIDCPCRLTTTGRKLLAGEADWRRRFGEQRWIGGVLLEGAKLRWRWNGRRLVELFTPRPSPPESPPSPPKRRRRPRTRSR